MPFKAASSAAVLAQTYSRGALKILGPAAVHNRHGKGQVIYIGSGLEAVYEETLDERLRAYFRFLLDPILASARTYEVEFRPGLLHQFSVSSETLLLHLLANTGNIDKKDPVLESFLPVRNVRVRIRLPEDRSVKDVSLMWTSSKAAWNIRNGWVELTVPKIEVYEIIKVDLS